MLTNNEFKEVIKLTPLVAIDMIFEYNNKILLGERKNEPAKGYYFIPGGRILKNETLDEAFNRLSFIELGIKLNKEDFKFHMNTQHIYDNNFFNNDFNTHYICLCYKHKLSNENFKNINLNNQHNGVVYMDISELLKYDLVHVNTKKYFINNIYENSN